MRDKSDISEQRSGSRVRGKGPQGVFAGEFKVASDVVKYLGNCSNFEGVVSRNSDVMLVGFQVGRQPHVTSCLTHDPVTKSFERAGKIHSAYIEGTFKQE